MHIKYSISKFLRGAFLQYGCYILLCLLQNVGYSCRGWRVGCNPPSVLGGIRLSGLPASLAETSSTPICPSTPGDGRFNASTRHTRLGNLACLIFTCQMDVSFLLRCQGSRPAPLRAPRFCWWAEFPQALTARKPPANSPALTRMVVHSVNKGLRFRFTDNP